MQCSNCGIYRPGTMAFVFATEENVFVFMRRQYVLFEFVPEIIEYIFNTSFIMSLQLSATPTTTTIIRNITAVVCDSYTTFSCS